VQAGVGLPRHKPRAVLRAPIPCRWWSWASLDAHALHAPILCRWWSWASVNAHAHTEARQAFARTVWSRELRCCPSSRARARRFVQACPDTDDLVVVTEEQWSKLSGLYGLDGGAEELVPSGAVSRWAG